MDKNMDLFQAIDEAKRNVKIWEEEIQKVKNFNESIEDNIKLWHEYEKSIETAKKNSEIIENTIKQLINFNWNKLFTNVPKNIKSLAEEWAKCGWIPSIPNYVEWDLMENITHPLTQKQADDIMLNKIDDEMFSELINEITNYNTQLGLNNESFKEAVECFNNKLYSACALLLFALIDSRFIINQPIPQKDKKERRKLADKAVSRAIDESKANYSIIALTAKTIIKQLFLDGDDFNYSREQGLNRNFVSHGMNKYNPDRTDCLKLFVLIYNIYFLFDIGFLTWSKP